MSGKITDDAALVEEGLAYFEKVGDEGDKVYVDAIRRALATRPAQVGAVAYELTWPDTDFVSLVYPDEMADPMYQNARPLIYGDTTPQPPPEAVAVVPEGWALVPETPTEVMLRRGWENESHEYDRKGAYADLLSASPRPPAGTVWIGTPPTGQGVGEDARSLLGLMQDALDVNITGNNQIAEYAKHILDRYRAATAEGIAVRYALGLSAVASRADVESALATAGMETPEAIRWELLEDVNYSGNFDTIREVDEAEFKRLEAIFAGRDVVRLAARRYDDLTLVERPDGWPHRLRALYAAGAGTQA